MRQGKEAITATQGNSFFADNDAKETSHLHSTKLNHLYVYFHSHHSEDDGQTAHKTTST